MNKNWKLKLKMLLLGDGDKLCQNENEGGLIEKSYIIEEVEGYVKGLNFFFGCIEILSRVVIKIFILVILVIWNGLVEEKEDQEIDEKVIVFVQI